MTTPERKPYPCFTEEDFPAVSAAAQAALTHAQAATIADPTSQVACLICQRSVQGVQVSELHNMQLVGLCS